MNEPCADCGARKKCSGSKLTSSPPPRFQTRQALQQGGIFVFEGDRVAYSHYDQATGAHADLDGVLSMVRGLAEAAAAGAAACDCAAPPPPAGSSA